MMKILMLNYEFPPIGGGSGNATFHLLKEFSKYKELDIDLVTASPGKYKIEKFSKNITLYRLNVEKKNIHYQTGKETFLWSIRTLFFLIKLHQKKEYDLCHCWTGWPSGFFGYFFEKDQKYIIGLRGSDVPGYNQRFKFADKIIFKPYSKIIWQRATKIIANSEGLKKLAYKTWKGQLDIIPNGIDTTKFKPGNFPEKPRLITVSRLIKRKGLEYLITALKDIDLELDIIGEGPELENLKRLAKEHNVKVNFLGYVKHDNLPKHYQKASIFVLPSLYEGMSNSILEAMASGLPIITTNTGGTQELIHDNGIIVKKKSSSSIRKAILTIINNDLIREQGKNSRNLALKMSWENVAKQYFNLYKELI